MSAASPVRPACVDVPALPLQLLLGREPTWARHPVVVVDRDEPQGKILWVNERARRLRVLPGRRYAAALSLAPDLRAGIVEPEEIDAAVAAIAKRLCDFSPDVEPVAGEPGVVFVDASGLEGVFPSLDAWVRQVVQALRDDHLVASVIVGFTRFGCYALARSGLAARVVATAKDERRLFDRVRLDRLGIAPKLRDALDRLGIDTVAGLRKLPPGGLLERFGADAHRLHERALGGRREPLTPFRELPPVEFRYERDPEAPRLDAQSLVFLAKQGLASICAELVTRGEALAVLHVTVLHEDVPAVDTDVEPAVPTLDEAQLVELVRLRFDSLARSGRGAPALGAEPAGIVLRAGGVRATQQQLALFTEAQKRDLKAADRALARLRAELGDDAVVRAVLRNGHLPEGRFRWERLTNLRPARPQPASPRLVRRLLARPVRAPQQRPGPDGWMPLGFEVGPVQAIHGPYVVSGGWWVAEQHREYHFAETERGDVLWLFYERGRRRWFLQGTVE